MAIAALGTRPVAVGCVTEACAGTVTGEAVKTVSVAGACIARTTWACEGASRAVVVGFAVRAVRLGPEAEDDIVVAFAIHGCRASTLSVTLPTVHENALLVAAGTKPIRLAESARVAREVSRGGVAAAGASTVEQALSVEAAWA